MTSIELVADAIQEVLAQRSENKTICPSEAARLIDPENWRELMPSVRDAGWKLAEDGIIEVTQQGRPVEKGSTGPIRYRKAR